MADPKVRSMSPTPRQIAFNPEPELFSDDLTAPERELWRRLQNQINLIWMNFQDIQSHVSTMSGFGGAWARIELSASNMSTINVADDAVTCASITPIEFDFMDTQRFSRVVLSPGHGVQPYDLYFDKMISTGRTDWPMSVWAADEKVLQLIQWNGTVWTPMPWILGWTISVVQAVPVGLPSP